MAKQSGYGVSTVSYALMDHPKIPETTRNKIKEVAKELSYVPNAFARGLKTKTCKTIGVISPGFKGPIHPTILAGVADVIKDYSNEYQMLVTLSKTNFRFIYAKQVDIAILLSPSISDEEAINISKICPLILFDKVVDNKNIYNTKFNNKESVAKRVIDFYKKGSTSFIFMKGSTLSSHNKERLEGFNEGISLCNIDKTKVNILDAKAFTEQHGYKCMTDYLKTNILENTALICANDELAIGAMKALKEFNYDIPKNVRVSGFDNIEKSEYVVPSLSTISIDWFMYGKKLGQLAMSIIKKKNKIKTINIKSVLIDRESGA